VIAIALLRRSLSGRRQLNCKHPAALLPFHWAVGLQRIEAHIPTQLSRRFYARSFLEPSFRQFVEGGQLLLPRQRSNTVFYRSNTLLRP
jgi:hypothetical protein